MKLTTAQCNSQKSLVLLSLLGKPDKQTKK